MMIGIGRSSSSPFIFITWVFLILICRPILSANLSNMVVSCYSLSCVSTCSAVSSAKPRSALAKFAPLIWYLFFFPMFIHQLCQCLYHTRSVMFQKFCGNLVLTCCLVLFNFFTACSTSSSVIVSVFTCSSGEKSLRSKTKVLFGSGWFKDSRKCSTQHWSCSSFVT